MRKLKANPFFHNWEVDPDVPDLNSTPSSDPSLSGEATIINSEVYGFQLVNNGPKPLYLYVFYFDLETKSIRVSDAFLYIYCIDLLSSYGILPPSLSRTSQ
jgi:hypothetical protein